MTRIVWLASYPKSGNTWARFIVTALLSGRTNFPSDGSMFDDVEHFVPDIYTCNFSVEKYRDRQRVFFKTHDRLDSAGEPKTRQSMNIPADLMPSERAVYVVRNPLDIVLSSWNHRRIEDIDSAPTFEQFFREFSEHGGDRGWSAAYGTWDENVESWTNGIAPFPVLTVRYEDMLRDPVREFVAIAAHLNIEATSQRVADTIEQFSFKRLRQQEDEMVRQGIFKFKGFKEGLRFFNTGKSGAHAGVLSDDQVKQVRIRFAKTMEKFGY